MTLTQLPRRSVVDEATDALRAQILHGSWVAGDALPTESVLTATLGVSRSTVREALARLSSAGLIEVHHGATRRVADFRDRAGLEVLADLVVSPTGALDLGAIRAITELRSAIAPDMARLAALRRTTEQSRSLVEAAAALSPASSLDELLLATLDWWTTLVHASDNLAYRLAYNTLRSTYAEGRPLLRDVIAAELRAVALYRAISTAVHDRDAEAAEQATRDLVGLGAAAIYATLATLGGTP